MHRCSSRLRLYLGLYLAAALVIGMAGCKEKPAPETAATPSAAVPPQPAPPAKDDRPVIVAFGDSLTAGYGTDAGNSYPDFLEKDLNAKGFHYHVVNAGVSGNTTKDGLDRLDDVLGLKPVLVIVAFGGNDGLRGLPIDSTRKNLDQIVSTLQHTGIKVVLGGITLPPNYGADYIRQFNETYALLARQYHVPLLPFLLQNVYGTDGSMQADGIHATSQGNQQVARNLLPLVTPWLHKN
jgi:acyl-CoA thioesterase I